MKTTKALLACLLFCYAVNLISADDSKVSCLKLRSSIFTILSRIKKAVLYTLGNYLHVVIPNGDIDYTFIEKSIFCLTIDERTSLRSFEHSL